jgi:hypothetical protein
MHIAGSLCRLLMLNMLHLWHPIVRLERYSTQWSTLLGKSLFSLTWHCDAAINQAPEVVNKQLILNYMHTTLTMPMSCVISAVSCKKKYLYYVYAYDKGTKLPSSPHPALLQKLSLQQYEQSPFWVVFIHCWNHI